MSRCARPSRRMWRRSFLADDSYLMRLHTSTVLRAVREMQAL